MKLPVAAAFGALACAAAPASALTVTPTSDVGALASTLFLNTNLSITSTAFSGQFGQAGTYTNAAGTYGLPNAGILLSTGNVADYGTGPNSQSSFTTGFNVEATAAQNNILQPITGQTSHFDVAQLDIDFFAETAADSVTFFATFGSEEFPEFVNSTFTDGFGLFVNGANVAGVQTSGGGANLPVNIDHPDFAALEGTELDGVLAPNGSPVLRFDVPINPSEANTFSIILADAVDDQFDTTVYLSSFFADDGGGGDPDAVGKTEFNPVLPSNPPDPVTGAFVVEIPADTPAGTTVWVDPPVSVGFEYELEGDGAFDTVTAPSLATIEDLDGYLITVDGETFVLGAGATLDFLEILEFNPTAFTLTGIDSALGLDPDDTAAFPLGISLTVASSSDNNVTITPITEDTNGGVGAIPLPAPALLYLGGLAIFGVALRRRKAARA